MKGDLILASIALKCSHSNSVCFPLDGQEIGIGAGQHSRIPCTRIAGDRWLRGQPSVLDMKFKKGVIRAEISNSVDVLVNGTVHQDMDKKAWENSFENPPKLLPIADRQEWLLKFAYVSLSSHAFFPFRDNIDRAVQSNMKYIISASCSAQDDMVRKAYDEHKVTLVHSNSRLFYHQHQLTSVLFLFYPLLLLNPFFQSYQALLPAVSVFCLLQFHHQFYMSEQGARYHFCIHCAIIMRNSAITRFFSEVT